MMRSHWPEVRFSSASGGATVRYGGSSTGTHAAFNLGDNTLDAPEHVAANRESFARALGVASEQVCWLRQVHGVDVVERAGSEVRAEAPAADAHWTRESDLVLTILTADCLPVLLADREGHCVGAAHAGWKGLCAGVIGRLIGALPSDARTLEAWIGPAISGASYEVGEEVRDAFRQSWGASVDAHFRAGRAAHFWCDLAQLARAQLLGEGVQTVHVAGYCTLRDERFYSYRRDGETGRQASFVRLTPPSQRRPTR